MADDLLDTINNIRSATGQRVINPILAAAIHANTSMAIEGENDRAAGKQAAADEKTTFMIKGSKMSVKNLDTTDYIAAAEDSGSRKIHEVAQLLQPASEAAKVHQTIKSYGLNTKDPNDPALLAGDQGSFRGGYRSARELGYGIVRSALHGVKAKEGFVPPASSQESDASQIQTQRSAQDLQIFDKAVKPAEEFRLQEGRAGREETRAEDAHRVALENEFERFTSPANVMKYTSSSDLSAAGKREFGDQWTSERDAAAKTSFADTQKKVASSKLGARRKAISEQITPDKVAYAGDADSYITNIEDPDNPFSSGDRAYAKYAFKGAKAKADRDERKQNLQITAQLRSADAQKQLADVQSKLAKGATGEAAIAGLPPVMQEKIKGIASGRIDLTKISSLRGNEREVLSDYVRAYDPTWSTATAPTRAAMWKDYTSGEVMHKSITPLNTAIHHLDEAKQAAAELKNAPSPIWNEIKKRGLEAVAGDPRYKKFLTATSLLSGEIGKLGKGGVPDREELQRIDQLLSSVNSPAQIDTVLNEYVRLMGGRAQPLAEEFAAGTGSAPPKGLIVTDSSEKVLRKYGFGDLVDSINSSGGGNAGAVTKTFIGKDGKIHIQP